MSDEWTDDGEESSLESQVGKINAIPLSDLNALIEKIHPGMTIAARNGYISL
jgi:hypothetical protein